MLLQESKPGRFGRAFAVRVFRTDFLRHCRQRSSRIGEWLV